MHRGECADKLLATLFFYIFGVVMPKLRKEILDFANKKPRVIKEIMEEFGVSEFQRETFRKRLKEAGIKLRENRGRTSIKF